MTQNRIKEISSSENNVIKYAVDEIDKNGVVIIKNFITDEDCNEIKNY
jgi:hypothetical protein